jgi:hypothetical protein
MAENKKPYGDVTYADPGHQGDKKKRYPVDTEEHIRAAWSYINKPENAKAYSSGDLASVKAKIVSAWKVKIDKEGPPSAKKSVEGDISKMASFEPGDHSNRTYLTMEGVVNNGKFVPNTITVRDCDYDAQGVEEVEGSEEQAREEMHYDRVLSAVREFLLSEDGHGKLQAAAAAAGGA